MEGLDETLAALADRLVDCDACRRVADKRGDSLEFAPGRLFGGRYDADEVISFGVRVQINPSVQVRFFRYET